MRDALALIALVALLRLPFLNQAIQGDDVNYLTAAQHAQIDPLHPSRARFVFQGDWVSMQGHPHPPLNAWVLAALLALMGDVDEPRYHASYAVFSLAAALAALSLARRFCTRPLIAVALFLSAPAFVVNGNSLESDIPFVALWLASMALFVGAVDTGSILRLLAAAVLFPLAAMAAFQSVVLVPILSAYLWQRRRSWRAAWLALLIVPITLAGWQLFERAASGQLPAQVLSGYFWKYGLQTVENKLRNAVALTAHLGWMPFPPLAWAAFANKRAAIAAGVAALGAAWLDPHPLFWGCFATGVLILSSCCQQRREFPALWLLLFFAAALMLFFAGSARYLLPVALPLAILLTRQLERSYKWVAAGIACQLSLSFMMAAVNYQHWDGYRRFVSAHQTSWQGRRAWINGEWGLRFYAESAGALPVVRGQAMRPGDFIIASELALPVPFTTGGGSPVLVAEATLAPKIPIRLIGLKARSAYSSAANGFRPFDVTSQPIDHVRLYQIAERKPRLSYLPMNAPEAEQQIVSGVGQLEDQRFRWMGKRAVILLDAPPEAAPIEVQVYLPEQAAARQLRLTLDGVELARAALGRTGLHRIVTHAVRPMRDTATLAIEVDRTFSAPGDHRELGIILVAAGFVSP